MTNEPIDFRRFRERRAAKLEDEITDGPSTLVRIHAIAHDLLKSFAQRVEPSWEEAEAASEEIEHLTVLQGMIVSRLSARSAGCLEDVAVKLELWTRMKSAVDPNDAAPEDRLIQSALHDLRRLVAPEAAVAADS